MRTAIISSFTTVEGTQTSLARLGSQPFGPSEDTGACLHQGAHLLGGQSSPEHTQVETSHVEEVGMETQATPHAPAARPTGKHGGRGKAGHSQ